MDIWTEDDFIGGHFILDFLNTVGDESKSRDVNRIASWNELISWLQQARLINNQEADWIHERFKNKDLNSALEKLLKFRELAYAVLSSYAANQEVPFAHLQQLGATFKAAIKHATFQKITTSFEWSTSYAENDIDFIYTRLVLGLSDFMQSQNINRVKECGRCTWLFVDRAPGVGRRWCRMNACGNRAKAERFRHR